MFLVTSTRTDGRRGSWNLVGLLGAEDCALEAPAQTDPRPCACPRQSSHTSMSCLKDFDSQNEKVFFQKF